MMTDATVFIGMISILWTVFSRNLPDGEPLKSTGSLSMWPPAPPLEYNADGDLAVMSIKVEGIEYETLAAEKNLMRSFKNAVTDAVVKTIGPPLSREEISMTLGPGSVTVEIKIMP